MSIYGEGEYQCAEHGRVAPGPAAGGAAARARLGAELPDAAAASSQPVGTSEAKALIPTSIYAITKRDHEELAPGHRRRVRHPHRRAPLLQRLRPRPGALEPLHRRGGDLRLPAAERARRRSSSRTARSHATSSTCPTSCGASCSRSSPTRAVGHAVNLGTGRPTTVADVAERHRGRARASTSSRSSTSSTGPATSGTAARTSTRARELLGFEAQVRVRATAWRELLVWLKEQEAVDRVDDATSELAARGLTK